MERRCAERTGEKKPCLWNEPFAAFRDLSLSLSLTLTVMKTRAAAAAGERATQLTDCLSGLMESVITDSPCPEADGNKLSRNHLWMRGQGERCAWFPSHASLGRKRNRAKSHIGFFLKSHLIYLVSSVHLFSNQTKRNAMWPFLHSVSDVPLMWSARPDIQQQADLNQGKVIVIWNAWGPSVAERLLGMLHWK